MMKLKSSRKVVRLVSAWLVCLGACSTRVSASQALPPRPSHSAATGTGTVEDGSSFGRLADDSALDDALQDTQEILRGGAAAFKSLQRQRQQRQHHEQHDPLLQADYIADTKLPTDMGNFRMRAYRVRKANANEDHCLHGTTSSNLMEPIIIYAADKPPFGDLNSNTLLQNVPIRIHDQCLTSEVFRSRRCDCKEQLNMAMEFVQRNGGAVIYLQQEGRGIGLANKLAAYELQDHGLDTVDANLHLGFPDDARQYGVLPSILEDMGIQSIRLITNNPRKVNRLTALGIHIVDTIPILALPNVHNRKYLETKQDRMAHTNFGHILANDKLPNHAITNNHRNLNVNSVKSHQYASNDVTP